jgi:hypothetical protein
MTRTTLPRALLVLTLLLASAGVLTATVTFAAGLGSVRELPASGPGRRRLGR